MKYDELIKDLRICASTFTESCGECSHTNEAGDCYNKLKRNAADAIEKLLGVIQRQKETINATAYLSLYQKPKWIPAKEKSPNRPGSYLCTVYGDSIGENYVTICDYSCRPWHGVTGWFGYTGANYREEVTNDVIAWMPLPEPPKEETDG